MKFRLPGDFTGGIMIFAIVIGIVAIELYVARALVGNVGVGISVSVPGGGGSDIKSARSRGGANMYCTRRGGKYLCHEEAKSQ